MKALTIDRSELLAGNTLNILTGGDGALHNRGLLFPSPPCPPACRGFAF